MRHIEIVIRGTVRAGGEGEADQVVRSALAGLKVFGLQVEVRDVGPVEAATVAPENVLQVQGYR
jgi:hypothetical protein